jgi:hypothetical protein
MIFEKIKSILPFPISYWPDQFGNINYLTFFLFLVLIFLVIFKEKKKIVSILTFIIISTFIIKSSLVLRSNSFCINMDSGGYTEYAKWISGNVDRFRLLKQDNIHFKSLLNYKNQILFLKEGNLFYLKDNKHENTKLNLKLNKIKIIKNNLYAITDNYKLVIINEEFSDYKVIFKSNIEITDLAIFQDKIFISLLTGKIVDISKNSIFYDLKIPIKNIYFDNNNIIIGDYNKKVHVVNTKDKDVKSYKISLDSLYKNQYENRVLAKSSNLQFPKLSLLFLSFSKKQPEIINIDFFNNNFYIFLSEGGFFKTKNIDQVINIANLSKNKLELQKNLNLIKKDFFFQDVIFLEKNKKNILISNNYYGDLIFFDVDTDKYRIIKNSTSDLEAKKEMGQIKVSQSHYRLPGYPVIGSFMMKISNNYTACPIILFQNLILITFLLIIFFLIKDKPFIYIFLFNLIIIDPTNDIIYFAMWDYPIFFEVFFVFIFAYTFLCKSLNLNRIILTSLIILVSAFISIKILIGIISLLISYFFYNLIFQKIQSHIKKNILTIAQIFLIIILTLVINKYFYGQKEFNQTNLIRKNISNLMKINSENFELNKVNNYKSLLKLPLEKENFYKLSKWTDKFGPYEDNLAVYSNIVAKYYDYNNDNVTIVDMENGSRFIFAETNAGVILSDKRKFIKEFFISSYYTFYYLFTFSSIQRFNLTTMWISVLIFFIGFFEANKINKKNNLIMSFSMCQLFVFYGIIWIFEPRAIIIFNFYSIILFALGVNRILNYLNNLSKKINYTFS